MKHPLVPFIAAMIAGIVIGSICYIDNYLLLISLFLLFLFLLMAGLKKWKRLCVGLLSLSFLFLGVLNINLHLNQNQGQNHIIQYVNKENVIIEGIIFENPDVSPDKTDIIVSVNRIIQDNDNIPVEGLILLSVKNSQLLKYGDYLRFKTRIRLPHNFYNPGGFDYEKYLKYKGVFVRGFIKDPSGIAVIRENQGNILKTELERFRRSLKKIIRDNSLSPEGEIIQAMILGDQKEIPKDVMEKFNKTGTTHIIAISGFNIGIIAMFSMIVIRLMMKTSTYLLLRFNITVVSTIFAIVPVIIYTFIAGMGISVIRAAIMAVTFMMAIVFGKARNLYNTLALAAFIILIISPYDLFDISFQLSFVAVWSILFITPRLLELFSEDHPELESKSAIFNKGNQRNILIFVIVSISATLGTLPLIVFYFNRISSVVLFSNFVVVPVLGVIAIPICSAIILAAPLSPAIAIFFVHVSSFLVWVSVSMVDFFASLPGSSFFVSTPTVLELTLYYILIISGIKWMDFRNISKKIENETLTTKKDCFWYRTVFVGVLLLFFADAVYLNTRDLFIGDLKVTAIDVGQGSSTLVQLPGGKRMLIDGGGFPEGSFDVGKYVVAPFLWYERINKIDLVVLTHPHPDHLNGLVYILSNFGVNEIWTNGQNSQSETYREFMRIISEKGIHHRYVSEQNESVRMNDVIINIINPAKIVNNQGEISEGFREENNQSIALRIVFRNVSFILPADISEEAETRIVHSDKDIRSQVLFVPHHGGFTSSTEPFIHRVLPEIAIISCGADNVYKVPHPDVLRRYLMLGTKIFRTDRNGAVSIVTDGENIIPEAFRRDSTNTTNILHFNALYAIEHPFLE